MIFRDSKNTVRLCCTSKGCPTVTKTTVGRIEIRDDYGNKIIITEEEAKLISQAVEKLNESYPI